MTKRHLFKLLSLSFGLLVALVICESALRIAGIGYGNAPMESHPILHHVHSTNYEFVAHTPTGEYGGHVVYYDEFGCRASRNRGQQPESGGYRIAFMGDSFTEATEVSFDESFAGQIAEQIPSARIRNYGVASYCPIFYLLQWRSRVKHFKPTHVIVQLFDNDIAHDAKYAKIAKFGSDGELLAVPGPGDSWLVRQARKSYFARFINKSFLKLKWVAEHGASGNSVSNFVERNPDMSTLSAGLLLQLAREVEASGAKFILTAIPSKFRTFNQASSNKRPQFSDKCKQWSIENGVEFLDLVSRFEIAAKDGERLFFLRDIHLNSSGHRIVAKAISSQLNFNEYGSAAIKPEAASRD